MSTDIAVRIHMNLDAIMTLLAAGEVGMRWFHGNGNEQGVELALVHRDRQQARELAEQIAKLSGNGLREVGG